MKRVLLGVQSVFAVIFIVLFIGTFTHVDQIVDESKESVSEKVTTSASGKVDIAEELLRSSAAEKYLKDYQIEAALEEIEFFKNNPTEYVSSIVKGDTEVKEAPVEKSINPLKNALIGKIFSWKLSLKEHFEKTLSNLIRDIRIFLISNVLALAVAAFFVYKMDLLDPKSKAVSAIVTVVVATSSIAYADRNWLYTIILNNYSGYGYPLSLISASIWLCYEYFSEKRGNA